MPPKMEAADDFKMLLFIILGFIIWGFYSFRFYYFKVMLFLVLHELVWPFSLRRLMRFWFQPNYVFLNHSLD